MTGDLSSLSGMNIKELNLGYCSVTGMGVVVGLSVVLRAQALTTSHAHSPRHPPRHPSRHHHTTPTHASGDLSVFSGKDIKELSLYDCSRVTGMTCGGGSIGSAEGPGPHFRITITLSMQHRPLSTPL